MSALQTVLSAIDAFNAQDPRAYELPYSEKLTAWVLKLWPEAPETLRIAARGQHIGRWTVPRDSYPMDRTGYLRWREGLKRFHAQKTGELMGEAGYPAEAIERVRSTILKKNFQTDPEAQTIEDALCLVFLETQFEELIQKTPHEKMIDIVQKTWKKMSPKGHEAALGLTYPPNQKALLQEALSAV